MVFGRFKNLFANPATPHTLDEAIARVETAEPGSDAPYEFGEDEKHRRINSLYEVAGLGLPLAPDTDFLAGEDFAPQHKAQECFDRLMVLYALSCCAYGDPRAAVADWLNANKLMDALSPWEAEIFHDSDEHFDGLEISLESQWALMWAISIVPELMPLTPADRDVGLKILPKLPHENVPEAVRKKARLRSVEELTNTYDLQYCLVASAQFAEEYDVELKQPVDLEMLKARLFALDWIFTEGDWEDATDLL